MCIAADAFSFSYPIANHHAIYDAYTNPIVYCNVDPISLADADPCAYRHANATANRYAHSYPRANRYAIAVAHANSNKYPPTAHGDPRTAGLGARATTGPGLRHAG